MMQDFLNPDFVVVKMVLNGIFGITGANQPYIRKRLSPWHKAQLLVMLDKAFAEFFKAYVQGLDYKTTCCTCNYSLNPKAY